MALLHVNFFSDVLGMATSMDVILPEQTAGQIGMEGKASDKLYPTLYLLHGMSDDHTIWQRRTSIERYVSDMGIAVVMPTTHLGWYTDMAQGNRYWTFISEELPAKCLSFFKNMSDRREDTFAAGLSMGGYGAFKLGLRCPDRFSAVASLSGGLDDGVLQNKRRADLGTDFRQGRGRTGERQRPVRSGTASEGFRQTAAQNVHVVRHGGFPLSPERPDARPSAKARL